MGYLFLAVAVLSGATKGYCGKKTSGYVNGYKDSLLANSVRMILCILIGLCMILTSGGVSLLKINTATLLISLLSGVANSAFLVFWLITVKKGAYMMLDVFSMAGVLIPMIGCAVLFNEHIRLNQIIGFVILLAAVYIMCSYNMSLNGKMTFSSFVLLTICGTANGLMDFSQKLFTNLSKDVPISVFNFYTYLFSAIILGVCCFVFREKSEDKTPTNLKPIFGYITIMAVCLFVNSYFKTLAASLIHSAKLYPLSQSSSLILSTFMSAIFFKEKITLRCVFGITVAFAALIIINVLKF